mmetsp:Transcript_57567/g.167188  ORF Transcript_57567/g.167188 Transcript_57567/m.167188 type:complete len:319 (+) Transcript_57567:674-1630(+)
MSQIVASWRRRWRRRGRLGKASKASQTVKLCRNGWSSELSGGSAMSLLTCPPKLVRYTIAAIVAKNKAARAGSLRRAVAHSIDAFVRPVRRGLGINPQSTGTRWAYQRFFNRARNRRMKAVRRRPDAIASPTSRLAGRSNAATGADNNSPKPRCVAYSTINGTSEDVAEDMPKTKMPRESSGTPAWAVVVSKRQTNFMCISRNSSSKIGLAMRTSSSPEASTATRSCRSARRSSSFRRLKATKEPTATSTNAPASEGHATKAITGTSRPPSVEATLGTNAMSAAIATHSKRCRVATATSTVTTIAAIARTVDDAATGN